MAISFCLKTATRSGCLFLALVTGSFTSTALAQSAKNVTVPEQRRDLLCHLWQLNKATDSTGLFTRNAVVQVQFIPDGYVVFNANTQTEGVWNYDAPRRRLFIILNSQLWQFNVVLLSQQQLVLENRKGRKTIRNYFSRANMQ